MAASFFDTNVLVYFASGEADKADRVEALLVEGGAVSVQVLNELALVCRRKFGFSWDEAWEALRRVRAALDVYAVDLAVHEAGLGVAERYKLSLYDSMLLAAALLAGCGTFWSEDLQDGLVVEGQLSVRNPFRPA
jgi:predicted nucleic acid-binding protein